MRLPIVKTMGYFRDVNDGTGRVDQPFAPLEFSRVHHDTPRMAWFYLFLGGALEIIWLIAMKYSNGFRNLWPSVIVVIALIASMIVVSLAIRTIPMGTAYAIWTGIGAAGGAIAGIVLFNESKDWLRLLSIALIIAGIVGLKLTAPADAPPTQASAVKELEVGSSR